MSSKRLRLDLASYAVPGTVWHVSSPTLNRRPIFQVPEMADAVVDALQFQCAKAKADLFVYCVMPDHIHAVVAIGDIDLISIMRDVKSWTTRIWTKRTGERRLWQESFHDHGVRRSENMDDLVRYVTENPQRAGLVADWQEYPWVGGSLLEIA
jgi:REP element-mobilizing transposase RayT